MIALRENCAAGRAGSVVKRAGRGPRSSRGAVLVRIVALAAAALASTSGRTVEAADSDVRVSSIGYQPGRAKHISVVQGGTAGTGGADFVVRRIGDDSAAFSGTLGTAAVDTATGDLLALGDFSGLTEAGSFYVDVPGVGRSVAFPIRDDVFREPFAAAMLGFLGWRCGAAVSFVYGGATFGHGACHLDDGHLDYLGQVGITRDGTRGWHDAGDYGKYTVNGAFALGTMLAAWERHHDLIDRVPLAVPEKGGPLPDFLAEMKWELDWLLSMQYSATDGRVSHKLTRVAFEDFIAPEADTGVRYFVPYGTAATADFVAALAQAARVFQPYDAAFSQRCLTAAQTSYSTLVAITANVAADQTGFTTGGYITTDPDDRLWAAAELWETTGDGAALADVEARINALVATVVDADFDWGNLKNLGLLTYLLSNRPGRNQTVVARVRSSALTAANAIVTAHDASRYGRGVVRYYWGSNGGVARTAMLLDAANRLSGDTKYLDVALDQVAYLFGRNHYNRSQVTGLGISPPLHPHHRTSASDTVDDPYPGLLVGGGTTAINWIDDQAMFMVNEVAVNWNGALVYALAMFLPNAGPPPTVDAGVDVAPGGPGGFPDAAPGGLPDAAPAKKSPGAGCSCDVGSRGARGSTRFGGLAILLGLAIRVARSRRRAQAVPGQARLIAREYSRITPCRKSTWRFPTTSPPARAQPPRVRARARPMRTPVI